ncbi:hypothetical protein [Oscillatoria sp. FACHB-1406]|uniref:hypothetical protein n=1 Tax=Oscillatoria sp. FACHB-1406 TaxID=2692846 RepID=UPI001688B51F|nr:hypothetical protein [Oscillatoria sp. FACHB-1406]MBD2578567.1 hypothetical protein [Oscillatoria sp. FACHB-1406]
METTQICQELTGYQIEIAPVPEARTGDIPIFIKDSRKVMIETGWKPQRDSKKTLGDIYQWIVQNEEQVRGIFG